MNWKPELDDLARREAFAREMGGVDKVKRQRDQGRLTVRDRIDKLVDSTSFHEIGAISGIAEYDEHGELKNLTPANCVFGRGKIDGRTVVVVTIGLLSAMYDEKRLHKEVAPRLLELGAAVGSLLEGADGELFSNRPERKALPVPTHNNKIIKTEDRNELEAGARRPGPARSIRARDGRR